MLPISVVIPVYNAEKYLSACLEHLAAGSRVSDECIVVDDGSADGSVEVARKFGATVISTGGRKGPAYARNLGAKAAHGEILFFIDSDVCVSPDTLARIEADFQADPQLDGLIGSYDDSPGSNDFLSLYRNLLHSFVHQSGKEEASTFWSGCGAIRHSVFLKHGGFDESYGRPAIEDIELGYRLRRAGSKVLLDKSLQVKHLKRWTFWNMVKTDIMDRGIPWTELILRDRNMPNDLNLRLSQRVSAALAFLMVAVAIALSVHWRGYFLTPIFACIVVLMARHWVDATEKPTKGVLVLTTGAFALLLVLCYLHDLLAIMPPVVLGYLLLFLRHRYTVPYEKRHRQTGLLLTCYIGLSVFYILIHFPHSLLATVLTVGTITLIVINNQFYLFLASRKGRLFAFSAIPFHLLYHLYTGISFMVGCVRYGWKSVRRSKLDSVISILPPSAKAATERD